MQNEQDKEYSSFYDSARNNRILKEDTTILLHLTAAISVGCVD